MDSFSLSITSMLSGYDQENNGIIVVSNGSDIIASNDPTLIGSSTDDLEILRKIKAEGVSDKLVQAKQGDGTFARYLGLMERGRDCYVYAFLPEQTVFRSTPRTMVYALVAYLILLAVTNAVRWRTAQVYHDEQIQAQIKHANNLREKNEQLIRAVDQADRANAAKTSFLSHMSHDIRTPLNGILGLLQIDAAHPDDTALLSANREKMRVAADHLLALINDILEMSQLESGEIVLAREPLDLETLTSDVFTIIEQRVHFTDLRVGENTFTFNATQLEGITVLDDTEKVTVRVVVPSDYTSKDIDVSAAGVKLNNVPAGYTAKVTALNSDSVTIIGPKSAISGLKAKNVMLSCDLTAKKGESIKTGTRQLPVTVSIAKADGTWAYGTYRATVELSKK